MTVDEFLKNIREISTHEGVVYGRLDTLRQAESTYGEQVAQSLSGYLELSDAFKCFYFETIERLNVECHPKVKTPLSEFYPIFMSRLNNNFLSLSGAEHMALFGYPLQAYTIHRNTFDNVVLSSAVLQKITDFYSVEGIDPNLPFDADKVKQKRKSVEWTVRGVMLGKDSGLAQETIDELLKLDNTYDLEVHGSRLSFAGDMEWIKGNEPLHIVPKFSLTDFALHMNRFVEVAWMVHRLILTCPR